MSFAKHHPRFHKLLSYLSRVPSVQVNTTEFAGFGTGDSEQGWYIKFSLDIRHPLAWHAVQEMGHVLNYLSVDDRLPTIFMPVSPPPYLNGGPAYFLSWVIECSDHQTTPGAIADWLEGRLPQPVEDQDQWATDD
ncbi:hypothetical protein [Erythrobacter sp. JK5]|uniref:hypothetical protein n=1 Tax=Erythrobacter sp. JK5 TaxID=2829500 RepID=UPI001BADBFCD|nr:hypothetical protein [Erythrobacter sp. JK5]QUL39104.1 hypothetical protein KDC96_07175 [Erythrobacter sp. JK5]